MKLTSTLWGLVLAALLSGCNAAVSLSPLYTDADTQAPTLEPRIVGDWVSPNLEKGGGQDTWSRVQIEEPNGQGAYTLTVHVSPSESDSGPIVWKYELHLLPIKGKLFFDGELNEQQAEGQTVAIDHVSGVEPVHWAGRLQVQDDLVRVEFLNAEWLLKNGPADLRPHLIESNSAPVTITSSTAELRNLLAQIADTPEAFLGDTRYLCRPESDCSSRAFEDALRLAPDSEELLEDAAQFFSEHGNYDRTIQLNQHLAQQDPKDSIWVANIGHELDLKRDFAGARREFAAATQLGLDRRVNWGLSLPAEVSKEIIWSYFLQGDYAGAIGAGAKYNLSGFDNSADPILLSYYSLLRLNRPAEARALLAAKTSQFNGPLKEHVLLLEAQDRVSDANWDWDALFRSPPAREEESRRYAVLSALKQLARNQPESARSGLERVAKDADKDSLMVLAAQIELERLGPAPLK